MSLSGDIGFNYTGNVNQGVSGHNMGFSGDANLNGSFYNPNFLNFNVTALLRSRAGELSLRRTDEQQRR